MVNVNVQTRRCEGRGDKICTSYENKRYQYLLAVCLLFVFFLRTCHFGVQKNGVETALTSIHYSFKSHKEDDATQISLKPQRIKVKDRDVLFQFPPRQCDTFTGVLFLYHGCNRSAASFFYSPQGRDMMLLALQSGFAVVVFEKPNTCWSEQDLESTFHMGAEWLEQYLLPHCGGRDSDREVVYKIPRFGFGASSGGSFVALMGEKTQSTITSYGNKIDFTATNVQIMAPRNGNSITIPTVFTVMDGDQNTLQRVNQISSTLEKKEVPSKVLVTHSKAITPEYFAARFKEMPDTISSMISATLEELSMIDKDTKELIVNPRWKADEIEEICGKYNFYNQGPFPYDIDKDVWNVLTPDEQKDAQTLWFVEELNVCYNQHEITAEYFDEILQFFMLHSEKLKVK